MESVALPNLVPSPPISALLAPPPFPPPPSTNDQQIQELLLAAGILARGSASPKTAGLTAARGRVHTPSPEGDDRRTSRRVTKPSAKLLDGTSDSTPGATAPVGALKAMPMPERTATPCDPALLPKGIEHVGLKFQQDRWGFQRSIDGKNHQGFGLWRQREEAAIAHDRFLIECIGPEAARARGLNFDLQCHRDPWVARMLGDTDPSDAFSRFGRKRGAPVRPPMHMRDISAIKREATRAVELSAPLGRKRRWSRRASDDEDEDEDNLLALEEAEARVRARAKRGSGRTERVSTTTHERIPREGALPAPGQAPVFLPQPQFFYPAQYMLPAGAYPTPGFSFDAMAYMQAQMQAQAQVRGRVPAPSSLALCMGVRPLRD